MSVKKKKNYWLWKSSLVETISRKNKNFKIVSAKDEIEVFQFYFYMSGPITGPCMYKANEIACYQKKAKEIAFIWALKKKKKKKKKKFKKKFDIKEF